MSEPRARELSPRHWAGPALAAALAGFLLALGGAPAVADVFSNVSPGAQPGLSGRYPLGNYALDHHFDAVKASVFGGVDVSGVPALIAYFLADVIWQLTAFLASALITLFAFAFSLDLVNGSASTAGAGALEPVGAAVRSLYRNTFGEPWLVVAIALAGLWAMWKALVQRRYAETAGALGLSAAFCVIALAFVIQPERTLGQASRLTNQMSAAFLLLSSQGDVSGGQRARVDAGDRLFELLVHQPWAVLNFGGLEHCTRPGPGSKAESVAVRPLSRDPARDAQLAAQLRNGTQIQADGKACINNQANYAQHFLAYPPESDERNAQYEALSHGDPGKLPDSDPAKRAGTYPLGPADVPAAEAMKRGGQFQRLLMAVVILIAELGAFLLLGALAAGVILAQVLVLLLLAFAPVALVAGIFPGRGHDFFRAWLGRLIAFLLRKAAYSLILAVLLAVLEAVGQASANLGWLLSFGLQAAFLWAVFLYRHQLAGQLITAAGGSHQRREPIDRLASLYLWRQLASPARRALRRPHRGTHAHHQPQSDQPPAPSQGSETTDSDGTVAAPDSAPTNPTASGNERPSPTPSSASDTPAARDEAQPPPPARPSAPSAAGPSRAARDGSGQQDTASQGSDPSPGPSGGDAPAREPDTPDLTPNAAGGGRGGEAPLVGDLRRDRERMDQGTPPHEAPSDPRAGARWRPWRRGRAR
ncbi:MAG: hypothetical protein QOE65_1138 [Solirubrobacteraceae bacterium]|jgi:hypothetical protein|nr:hypothetical protein [Solirubrobacteraceae bacterium]